MQKMSSLEETLITRGDMGAGGGQSSDLDDHKRIPPTPPQVSLIVTMLQSGFTKSYQMLSMGLEPVSPEHHGQH